VEVVDLALQRDREVEQVARPAPEDDRLRRADARPDPQREARSNAIAATAPAAIATASDPLTA
jgi:hypothetical protein